MKVIWLPLPQTEALPPWVSAMARTPPAIDIDRRLPRETATDLNGAAALFTASERSIDAMVKPAELPSMRAKNTKRSVSTDNSAPALVLVLP